MIEKSLIPDSMKTSFWQGFFHGFSPSGFFFLIWRFAMNKLGSGMGVMSFGKNKAKIFAENDTKVSFADVAGIDSESKAAQIDEEIARFIEEAHQRVRRILMDRRNVLDDLARLLSTRESVQGEELRKMLAETTSCHALRHMEI